uniref:BZIP domain-containing protein n=1 Tax=Globodera pallida TaxID=36090 RepID=A0A183BWV3_GLOPA
MKEYVEAVYRAVRAARLLKIDELEKLQMAVRSLMADNEQKNSLIQTLQNALEEQQRRISSPAIGHQRANPTHFAFERPLTGRLRSVDDGPLLIFPGWTLWPIPSLLFPSSESTTGTRLRTRACAAALSHLDLLVVAVTSEDNGDDSPSASVEDLFTTAHHFPTSFCRGAAHSSPAVGTAFDFSRNGRTAPSALLQRQFAPFHPFQVKFLRRPPVLPIDFGRKMLVFIVLCAAVMVLGFTTLLFFNAYVKSRSKYLLKKKQLQETRATLTNVRAELTRVRAELNLVNSQLDVCRIDLAEKEKILKQVHQLTSDESDAE